MTIDTFTRPAAGAIPGQRKAAGREQPVTVRAKHRRPTAPGGAAEAISYLDFFHGFGAGLDVDLGLPKAYSYVPTTSGCVFREDFEYGIALCNCGEDPAEVTLEKPYLDEQGHARKYVRVEPYRVVLLAPQA